MTQRHPAARGFTLIELMITVAIIGMLASVALPNFQRLTYRSKTAERGELLVRLRGAVNDYYIQHGRVTSDAGAGFLGGFQPPLPAGSTKRMPNWAADDWPVLLPSGSIEGATYYSYRVQTIAGPPDAVIITAVGDLDGDGIPATKTLIYQVDTNGLRLVLEDPPRGEEDPSVF